MAPNANTHLLTHRDYFRHPPPWEYGGVVLQLDLGDGATHTPRPGSRAQRNSVAAQQNTNRQREHAPVTQAMSCLRTRSDEDELRAAIELSVMRAYSSFHGRASASGSGSGSGNGSGSSGGNAGAVAMPLRNRPSTATLPQPCRTDQSIPRSSPRLATRAIPSAARLEHAPHLVLPLASPSPCPSPRRREYPPRPHHDYRLEAGSYGSASTSRGHSPNNYA